VGRAERAYRWCRRHPREAVLGSLLLAGVLGVAAFAWVSALARAAQYRAANVAVQPGLEALRTAYNTASEPPADDLGLWGTARAAARDAKGLADRDGVEEHLRQEVDDLLARVEAGSRRAAERDETRRRAAADADFDRRLREQLIVAQAGRKAKSRAGAPSAAELAGDITRTFARFDLDLDQLPVEEAARRLGRRSIAAELCAAVDQAAVWRKQMLGKLARPPRDRGEEWQHLFQITRRADPDPQRNRLRDLMAGGDGPALRRLARQPDILVAPAMTLRLLGELIRDPGDDTEAIALLRQAQARNSNDFWINIVLASYLAESRPPDHAGAARFAQAAAAVEPNNFAVQTNLGIYLGNLGDERGAELAFRRAVELNRDSAEAHHGLGVSLHRQGKLGAAEDELRLALRLHEAAADVQCALGAVLLDRREIPAARQAFQRALELKADYPLALCGLGNVRLLAKELSAAEDAFRKALRLQKDYPEAHDGLGIALLEQGDAAGAVKAMKQAVALRRDNPQFYYNLGNALAQNDEPDEAAAAYRQAIRLKKDFAEAYFNLGVLLRRTGDGDGALWAYRKAVEYKPDFPEARKALSVAYYNEGNDLLQQRDLPGAAAAYRQAVATRPNFPEALCNLGIVLAQDGDTDGAVKALREAIRLKSDFAVAHCNLGNALLVRQDYPAAVAAYQAALNLRKNYPEALCGLGHAQMGAGQLAAAVAAYRRGHELGSRTPGWTQPSAQWLRQAERLQELEKRLPDVLSGKESPADAAEQAAFAELCLKCKQLPANASR
jgi:tetratricopeptide (TPR) repeat protein